MKGLILTMTCGEGHNAVARSLKTAFEEKNVEIEVVDIFKSHPFLHKWNNEYYFLGKKLFPHLADAIWKKASARDPEKRDTCKNQSFTKKIYDEIKKIVVDGKYDFIVCSHNFASTIITNMKKENIALPPTFAVLTDMIPHPYWEASIGVDYIITPNDDCDMNLIKRGFKKDQIVPLGLPVAEKFNKYIDKHVAREMLNLPDKFTILLTSGGNGHYSHMPLAKALTNANIDANILVGCAKNERMKKAMEKYKQKCKNDNLHIYGFVNNMDVMLSASDALVTVGGCNCLCEGIVKNVPLIFREKLIVNERENCEYILSKKLGYKLNMPSDIVGIVNNMMSNPDSTLDIKNRLKLIARPHATKNIVEFVLAKSTK